MFVHKDLAAYTYKAVDCLGMLKSQMLTKIMSEHAIWKIRSKNIRIVLDNKNALI